MNHLKHLKCPDLPFQKAKTFPTAFPPANPRRRTYTADKFFCGMFRLLRSQQWSHTYLPSIFAAQAAGCFLCRMRSTGAACRGPLRKRPPSSYPLSAPTLFCAQQQTNKSAHFTIVTTSMLTVFPVLTFHPVVIKTAET